MNYHVEMLEWKERADTLKHHLEKDLGEKVRFADNPMGKAVYIEGAGRMELYYTKPAESDVRP